MEDNIFHEFASKKSFLRPCLTLLRRNSLIDKLNAKNFEGSTPLDVAIDYENWNMLQLFIQFNVNKYTIVKAIGELLSHYWHIGSRSIDKFIFQLIIKKGYLSKLECVYLIERAFDGNAWPFVVPLLNCSNLSHHRIEKYFHWQIADMPILRTALANLLKKAKRRNQSDKSIFIYSDNKLRIDESIFINLNEKYLLSFIYRRRKLVAKNMKRNVRENKISYRLIKRLIHMY